MRAQSIVAAVIAAGAALPAFADPINLPARKPGEWKIEMVRNAKPAMTMQFCLDAAFDKAMMEGGLSLTGDTCSSVSTKQDGGTITIDAACQFGPMATRSHTVMTGDFQSAYTVTTTSDNTGGGPLMPKHSEITQNVTWIGACSGLKPGEMLMPNGMKIDALHAMKPTGG